ncbi:hypothetical protein MCEMSEM23_02975 [Rhabdaerophilaceae bacterium]
MAIESVNGYNCANCAEVSLAKRGIDPQAPKPEQVTGVKAEDAAAARAPLDFSKVLDKLA